MATNNTENYLRWITPTLGDPTFSVLKAHLLFEELLHSYLKKALPHAEVMDGARFTFAQTLAIVRAACNELPSDHWSWQAVGELNKIRNLLAHESRPKAIAERLSAYSQLVQRGLKAPLPEPAGQGGVGRSSVTDGDTPMYLEVDMVTIGLYYHLAALLGFDVNATLQARISDNEELQNVVIARGAPGAT
ncbi:MAG: hypothetical protein KF892_23535 [Rhizobacter sp.]|nr:hypothetical protein [Rhizobacter sp.]